MGEVVSFSSHRNKQAAERGFREWRRLFKSITDFNENTKWDDLPDEVVLFFCEEKRDSRLGFYDLIMGSHRLGNGCDFEMQPYDRLAMLMNAYFLILDQARFECMRRLGWLETVPRAEKPIIEVVMDPATYECAALLETPAPTPDHPAYEEDAQSRGIDRAALVRKHTPAAIELFKQKVTGENAGNSNQVSMLFPISENNKIENNDLNN
jgi:hypothetical protein